MARPCRPSLLLLLLVLLLAAPSVLVHGFLLHYKPPPRRALQAAAGPTDGFEPSERTPETLRAFEAWLRTKGGLDLSSDSPVALHLDPHTGSITLTTTRPIEKDQIVLAVPEPLLLTSTTLPPALAAAAEAADLDGYGRLALRLLAEAAKGEEGEWWPYLQVLPRRGDMHLPILWDDDALLPLLAPSPLHDDVTECRAAMRAELASLHAALTPSQQQGEEGHGGVLRPLDWARWTWARAIAMSRPYILDPEDDNATAASLTLIPVVDMADHCDAVRYAVQRGDGVFTSRSDVQLVADRAYPTPGQPFWNTYGPGLSSASKLYSFGYLETLSLDGEGGSDVSVPLQGTALFVVGLKEEDEEEDASRHAKAAILASVGLAPKAQRVEVATRTSLTETGLSAMVAIEDHVTAPDFIKEEGGEDGGLERLLRFLRLKHIPAPGLTRLLADGDGRGVWDRLASGRCSEWVDADVEVAAALEAVALCREGLRRVGPQWQKAEGAGEGGLGGGDGYRHRVGLVRTLLHGEVLALRAVAEACMGVVEAAEGRRRSID